MKSELVLLHAAGTGIKLRAMLPVKNDCTTNDINVLPRLKILALHPSSIVSHEYTGTHYKPRRTFPALMENMLLNARENAESDL